MTASVFQWQKQVTERFGFKRQKDKPGEEVYFSNFWTWEAEAGGSLIFRGQSRLHRSFGRQAEVHSNTLP